MLPTRVSIINLAVAVIGTLLVLLPAGDLRAADADVVTLPVRDDARLRFLILRPDGPPTATVILYSGGNGTVGIKRDGSLKRDGNFLVRTRELFAKHGFLVAVVDRPSDWAGSDKERYRLSTEHVEDAAAIARKLREIARVPVWFVGTSRGSISIANIASRLGGDLIAGAVLSSSVTRIGRRAAQTVGDADLGGIAVPVLIVGHVNDDCFATPWPDQFDLRKKFRSAPVVDTIRIEGGDAGNHASPCGPFSHHGFLGQEDDVVAKIAGWIKGHAGRR